MKGNSDDRTSAEIEKAADENRAKGGASAKHDEARKRKWAAEDVARKVRMEETVRQYPLKYKMVGGEMVEL